MLLGSGAFRGSDKFLFQDMSWGDGVDGIEVVADLVSGLTLSISMLLRHLASFFTLGVSASYSALLSLLLFSFVSLALSSLITRPWPRLGPRFRGT